MKPDRKKGETKAKRELHPPVRSGADDPEPSTGTGGFPVILFILVGLGLYFAMVYLDNHAGGFNPVVPRPYISSNQLVGLVPIDPTKTNFYAGLKIYNRPTCGACHQANGLGTPGTFPPLDGSEWVLEKDPGRVIRIVLDGLTGPIRVKGAPYNSQMPGWRTQLSEQEIAQVSTYIRQAWNNKASAVTTEQVARIKQETANRNGALWTVEELMKVPVAQ